MGVQPVCECERLPHCASLTTALVDVAVAVFRLLALLLFRIPPPRWCLLALKCKCIHLPVQQCRAGNTANSLLWLLQLQGPYCNYGRCYGSLFLLKQLPGLTAIMIITILPSLLHSNGKPGRFICPQLDLKQSRW